MICDARLLPSPTAQSCRTSRGNPNRVAYRLGRLVNKLDWATQIGFLTGDETSRNTALWLPLAIARMASTIVPPADAMRLVEMAERYHEQFVASTLERKTLLADAADRVAGGCGPEYVDLEAFRQDCCEEVLLRGPSTDFIADAITTGLTEPLRRVFELGVIVDRGLRPAPAYHHVFRPVASESSTTVQLLTFVEQFLGSHAPRSGAVPLRSVASASSTTEPVMTLVEQCLVNHVPCPGAAPLTPTWWTRLGVRWRNAWSGVSEEAVVPLPVLSTSDAVVTVREVRRFLLKKLSAPATVAEQASSPQHIFARDGQVWLIRFGDEEGRFKDHKIMTSLRRLLENPGKGFSYMELQVGVAPQPSRNLAGDGSIVGTGSREPQLTRDRETETQIKQKFVEIQEELRKAARNHDEAQQEIWQREMDKLTAQVNKDSGVKGEARPIQRDDKGRAKDAFRKSLSSFKQCLENADRPMSSFVQHLKRCLHDKQDEIIYDPPIKVVWLTTSWDGNSISQQR